MNGKAAKVEVEAQQPHVLSFCEIAQKMWFLFCLSATLNLSARVAGDLTSPYLYTRVECCKDGHALPHDYNVADPGLVQALQGAAAGLGVELHLLQDGSIAACDAPALPPSNPWWSMSSTCVSKAFVEEKAQGVLGVILPVQKAVTLLVLPISLAVSDISGRWGVLLVYATAGFLGCLMFLLDTQLTGASLWRDLLIYTGGSLTGMSWEPKDAMILACIADMTGHGMANKSRANFQNYGFLTGGAILAYVVALVLARRKYENYFVPWMIFSGIAFTAVLQCLTIVKETLPMELRRPWSLHDLNPMMSWRQSLHVLGRDPVLVLFTASDALLAFFYCGYLGQSISYLVMIGFGTDVVMLPGLVSSVAEAITAFCMVPLIMRVGPFTSCITSQALQSVGYFLVGPVAILWQGAVFPGCCCIAAGVATYLPARSAIVSERVEEADQGKCFAGLYAGWLLGVLVASPFYSFVLFSASSTGLRTALPECVSLCLSMLNIALNICIAVVARRVPSAREVGAQEAAKLAGGAGGYGSTTSSKAALLGSGGV